MADNSQPIETEMEPIADWPGKGVPDSPEQRAATPNRQLGDMSGVTEKQAKNTVALGRQFEERNKRETQEVAQEEWQRRGLDSPAPLDGGKVLDNKPYQPPRRKKTEPYYGPKQTAAVTDTSAFEQVVISEAWSDADAKAEQRRLAAITTAELDNQFVKQLSAQPRETEVPTSNKNVLKWLWNQLRGRGNSG